MQGPPSARPAVARPGRGAGAPAPVRRRPGARASRCQPKASAGCGCPPGSGAPGASGARTASPRCGRSKWARRSGRRARRGPSRRRGSGPGRRQTVRRSPRPGGRGGGRSRSGSRASRVALASGAIAFGALIPPRQRSSPSAGRVQVLRGPEGRRIATVFPFHPNRSRSVSRAPVRVRITTSSSGLSRVSGSANRKSSPLR